MCSRGCRGCWAFWPCPCCLLQASEPGIPVISCPVQALSGAPTHRCCCVHALSTLMPCSLFVVLSLCTPGLLHGDVTGRSGAAGKLQPEPAGITAAKPACSHRRPCWRVCSSRPVIVGVRAIPCFIKELNPAVPRCKRQIMLPAGLTSSETSACLHKCYTPGMLRLVLTASRWGTASAGTASPTPPTRLWQPRSACAWKLWRQSSASGTLKALGCVVKVHEPR